MSSGADAIGDEGGPSDPGSHELVAAVAERLTARGLTLGVAESCTGGLVTARLTDRPGASEFLVGGVVAYANHIKRSLLDVSARTLETDGAVSEATARAMARGVRGATGARVGLSVTGVAGPGGGTPPTPVGTVWWAAALGDSVRAEHARFPGDRRQIRERSVRAALELLQVCLDDG